MPMKANPEYTWIENPVEAHFIERLNRFACLVRIDGIPTKVYLPNSGRLDELLQPEAKVLLEKRRQQGKTLHDLLLIETRKYNSKAAIWAAVDSRLPPSLLRWLIQEQLLESFPAQADIKMEPAVANGRLDLKLSVKGDQYYIEAKSVNLVDRNGVARFPDAPTVRGQRHLQELIHLKQAGHHGSLVFIILREDAEAMAPFEERDPAFCQGLTAADRAGVELMALKFQVGPAIRFIGRVPLRLKPEPFPGYWPPLES